MGALVKTTPQESETKLVLAELSPEQAIALLTAEGVKLYKKLKQNVDRQLGHELEFYWETGRDLAKAMKESAAKKDNGKYCQYGAHLVGIMSAALGFKSHSTLSNCVTIYKCWPTKAKYQELQRMAGEANIRLYVGHMIALAKVNDKNERQKLAVRALKERWDTKTLQSIIHSGKSTKARSPGAAPKPPRSPLHCAANIRVQAFQFVNKYDNAWTGDAYDLAKEVEAIPANKLKPLLASAVDDARAMLQQLRLRVSSGLALLDDVSKALHERLKAIGQLDAEENEDADCVNLGAMRNAAARAKRAAAAEKKKAAAKRRAGRVGTKRPN